MSEKVRMSKRSVKAFPRQGEAKELGESPRSVRPGGTWPFAGHFGSTRLPHLYFTGLFCTFSFLHETGDKGLPVFLSQLIRSYVNISVQG